METINPALVRYAFSLTGNKYDADDLVATAYANILNTYGENELENEALMIRTIHNSFIDKTRADKKFSKNINVEDLQIIDDQTPLNEIEKQEKEQFIKNQLKKALLCLQQLKDIQKSIVTLFSIEKKKYREISEILEVPLGTVMSSLKRGRETIADCVKKS